jgi:succinate dehydrogenase flavin-adding protein (antitoxin of CptAB toxin-antitoxin module)
MKITRKLETANATYDLTELTKRQFSDLLHCYEKQMYIYCNREMPEDDELLNKMRKMADNDTYTV